MRSAGCERCESGVDETRERFRFDGDVGSDPPAGNADEIEKLRSFVDEGRELLFHPDRRTAAVNVTCERQKLFHWNHLDVFASGGAGGAFEVEFGGGRNHEDEMFVVDGALCDQRFEHLVGSDADLFRNRKCVDTAVGDLVLVEVPEDARAFKEPDRIGFDGGVFHDSERILRAGEFSVADVVGIRGECLTRNFAEFSVTAGMFRRELLEQPEDVVHHLNLPVAPNSGTDADRGDFHRGAPFQARFQAFAL